MASARMSFCCAARVRSWHIASITRDGRDTGSRARPSNWKQPTPPSFRRRRRLLTQNNRDKPEQTGVLTTSDAFLLYQRHARARITGIYRKGVIGCQKPPWPRHPTPERSHIEGRQRDSDGIPSRRPAAPRGSSLPPISDFAAKERKKQRDRDLSSGKEKIKQSCRSKLEAERPSTRHRVTRLLPNAAQTELSH
jgi:hypothetical protein